MPKSLSSIDEVPDGNLHRKAGMPMNANINQHEVNRESRQQSVISASRYAESNPARP
jgi:hypothetical protein